MDEVQKVLQEGLSKNFASVHVSIVECPDLTSAPFNLSAPGLCGNAKLVDIGGPPFLFPYAQRDKVYSFRHIADMCDSKEPFMLGAGAGPAHVLGVNSEMMNTIKLEPNGKSVNRGYVAKIDKITNACQLQPMPCDEFNLMGNFLVCDGLPGQVFEVKASTRIGEEDFSRCLKNSLKRYYGEKPVALGGVFLIEQGKANIHIMSDFSESPITSEEQVNQWLKFFEMGSTLVCLGELVSHDPGYDLRDEHFHCFNDQGEGGHYHYDTTPQSVQYRGYFVMAHDVYRIDQPAHKLVW
ncbi:hypothetical protein DPMN_014888 [Dreissena polymorpha]|uniref:DUF1907 domain-containing protein n=2 Tax=Dreissena polymorpha TaxID=45954 RepID=A0A9D4NAI6_DREPO|nr:hypothetical protein DPMN_014888 [Dreissena polymorpha]